MRENKPDNRCFTQSVFDNLRDEAIAEYKIAMDLEPASYLNKQVFSTGLYFARRYDEASTQFQRLIDLDPTGYVPITGL